VRIYRGTGNTSETGEADVASPFSLLPTPRAALPLARAALVLPLPLAAAACNTIQCITDFNRLLKMHWGFQ
jgi:hypothetical protein